MSRTNTHGNEVLRRFIQQAESYNRCMFSKTKQTTDDIDFCEKQMKKLNLNRIENERRQTDEILKVDIVSNQYKYAQTSIEFNQIQQCSVISIISPYAFTIQFTKDLQQTEQFLKSINDYYNSIDDLHIPQEYIRENLLCVTWNETSRTWNRSQILECDFHCDTVSVFFVDLNSWEENVSRTRLRFILTKYSCQPVYVLTCRLASIQSKQVFDSQTNDVTLKTFQNVIENCQCDVEILYEGRDQTCYVNLFAAHQEAYVCVNDFLIHCQMAKPFDDISNEKNLIYMTDKSGEILHPMIALYWKGGESTKEKEVCDHQSSASNQLFIPKESLSWTKFIQINRDEKIVFARYKNYIMLPWLSISDLLKESNEEQIEKLANRFGFKPIVIDRLTHPKLYSELIQSLMLTEQPSEIRLYSIDCIRKIFEIYEYEHDYTYEILDRARLAEASNDLSFWKNASESVK